MISFASESRERMFPVRDLTSPSGFININVCSKAISFLHVWVMTVLTRIAPQGVKK
jgi:hypothetical protein